MLIYGASDHLEVLLNILINLSNPALQLGSVEVTGWVVNPLEFA